MTKVRNSVFGRVARTPSGGAGLAILLVVGVIAVVAPFAWGEEAARINSDALSASPSAQHLLGTDALGRDILYRLLVGTRTSVMLALAAATISVVLGVLLGAAPSLSGPRFGRFFAGIANLAVAFPGLLVVLFCSVVFGVTTFGAVLALGVAGAPFYARLVQTLAGSISGRDFIAAAKVAGVSRFRILTRHLIPNMGEQLSINAMLTVGSALLSFAGLSFLGIGVQAPQYDWGVLLNQGLLGIYVNPLGALGPAVALIVAGLGFNLFGEGAARVLGQRSATAKARLRPPLLPRRDATVTDETSLLKVENLQVSFPDASGWITPVRGVTFGIAAGESIGVVGESGSGKSITALAVAALIERPGSVLADVLEFDGTPMVGLEGRGQRKLGTTMAMVFQDPMSSLNPALRVGTQLAEVAIQHEGLGRKAAHERAVARLQAVHLQGASRRVRQYPHELSGGMRQRVMIAMGTMGTPKLVIADEPTTALDVTVQQQVLREMKAIQAREGAALLLISHDITVITQTCDRVMVMYAGEIVEDLPADQLFERAQHPYTRALIAAVPDMETEVDQRLAVIPGRPPEPREFPVGCAFASRCHFATDKCTAENPVHVQIGGADRAQQHRIACWHPQVADNSDGDAVSTDVAREAYVKESGDEVLRKVSS